MKKKSETIVLDPNFKPAVPTKVLAAVAGSVSITTKLYGSVSPERLEREQTIVRYRADQLLPVPKRPERIERVGRSESRDRDWSE